MNFFVLITSFPTSAPAFNLLETRFERSADLRNCPDRAANEVMYEESECSSFGFLWGVELPFAALS